MLASTLIVGPNGITYKSMKYLALAYNVKYYSLKQRLKNGWSLEEACNLVKRKKIKSIITNNKKITCPNGVTYNSIGDMCKAYDISVGTYNYHLRKGLSIEDILSSVEVICPKGVKYKSIEKMCEAYNIPIQTYYSRIQSGKSIEESLSSKIIICPKGIEYKSIGDMCKAYNIKHSTYSARIKSGMSMEEALLTELSSQPDISLQEKFHNVTFSEILRKHKVQPHMLNKYIKYYLAKDGTLTNFILMKLLFLNPLYCGITKEGNILLKDGENDFKQIPFKEYIENLN